MWIQISWLLMKPADQDPNFFMKLHHWSDRKSEVHTVLEYDCVLIRLNNIFKNHVFKRDCRKCFKTRFVHTYFLDFYIIYNVKLYTHIFFIIFIYLYLIHHYMGRKATKPVFGVSDKVGFKPVSSATETS